MKKVLILLLFPVSLFAQKFTSAEIKNWEEQASQVTITRDMWGVPHIVGKTDADAVFGMLYTQCEDDFPRVERNYIVATARLAEAEGENFIYNDLRVRLFLDTTKAISLFATSPPWLQKLCNAFADGANYYLHTHPQVKPKLLTRFKPWMPLLFSEGSIGGDIESVSLNDLKGFYGKTAGEIGKNMGGDGFEPDPGGSNGFAIAPARSANGNALLLINPHTSFYFRSELHVTSGEGLNAYGAVTWGQFFIYQGFNEHCGWMHTSSQADVIDSYTETIIKKGKQFSYKYGSEVKAFQTEKVTIAYKTDKGLMKKDFTLYRNGHGPVANAVDGKWVTVKLMTEPVKALSQSFLRTKSSGFDEFRKVMDLKTNSSNNTVFADDKGNIAYWHGDFMPKRDPQFNWAGSLDGSNPATEWKGMHEVDEIVHVYNPANGWIQNCNSTPFTVSGPNSPDPKSYPKYMAPDFENFRGIHAVKVLKDETAFTVEKLISAAYDPYLPAFEKILPALLKSYDNASAANDTLKQNYSEAIQMLKKWDMKWSDTSVPTTLAIFWVQKLRQAAGEKVPSGIDQETIMSILAEKTTDAEKMKALAMTTSELKRDFGSWKQYWGATNRFQRISGSIEPVFDDTKPSVAVPFTSATWGSLASFVARKYPGTKRIYGSSGNSFVAAVEFGRKVRAKSVTVGGSTSDPNSPHFNDQGPMYAQGRFKDVLFYKDDYERGAEKTYRPGQK